MQQSLLTPELRARPTPQRYDFAIGRCDVESAVIKANSAKAGRVV
jgi:hypothetical protein